MNKNIKVEKVILSLIIVIVVVMGIVFLVDKNNKKSLLSLEAVANYVQGAVEYKSVGGEWVRLKEGSTLSEGDSVETFGDGRAIIQIDDGSMLRLNNNSSITLKSMNPKNLVVSNDSGEVYSRVVKLDRIFQVTALDTVYESLGTAYLTINNEKQNGVEVFDSKVKVINKGKETIVNEGKMFFVNNDKKALEKVLADIPKEEMKNGSFVAWNKAEDAKTFSKELGVLSEEKETKEVEEKDLVADSQDEPTAKSIVLTNKGNGNISWVYNKVSDQGFKVVWSKNSNPTYPTRSGDQYIYLSSSNNKSSTVSAFDGSGNYYVRVCEYLGGKCGVYSNQIKVTLSDSSKDQNTEEDSSSSVSSIILSGNQDTVSWIVKGNSDQGFKVVWSKNANPTYPTRSGDQYIYLSNSDASSQSLTPFDGDGAYYVRVCEYLGGKCGVYSNQIKIEF